MMETKHRTIEVSAAELPVCCPPQQSNKNLWSAHPRVYLDVSQGEQACPYCGTHYRIKAGEQLRHHHA